MRFRTLLVTVGLVLIMPTPLYAAGCGTLTVPQKFAFKASDIRDGIMLWLLMDPVAQIRYRIERSNTLYYQAKTASGPNLAYAYVLHGEDQMTRVVGLVRYLYTTERVDMDAIEQAVNDHVAVVSQMQGACDWSLPQTFMQDNWHKIQNEYYLNLPTDTRMQLLVHPEHPKP